MTKTHLGQALEATSDARATYDANIKFLLADKQVLARILKYAVEEFADMSIEDIIASIGDDVEIGTKGIDAGLSNMGRIVGTATEDSVPGEGKVVYDIRFSAYPKGEEMKFLMNVEAQKSSNPGTLGYHLENRMVFYLARMISAQKQTEFYHSDYDGLKKVRSIWICMDAGEDNDSIEEIYLGRRTLFGKVPDTYNVDLLRGIIIRIRSRKNVKASENALIAMLEELISQKSAEEKKQILTEEYGMKMTVEMEGRLQTMCNWSEAIAEREREEGWSKGLTEGRAEGLAEGRAEGLAEGLAEGRVEGLAEGGAKQIIEMGLEFELSEEEIQNRLQKKLNISLQEAQEYFERFGRQSV